MNEDESPLNDEEEEEAVEANPAGRQKSTKKQRRDTLRKAPQAPKRFKSSYICFFMAKQPEIKVSLGDKATVTEISKRSAEMWKNLPADERAYWDDVAAKDKERYMVEKASYTGPWQVPWKRAKKDPSAPKRPMSAFLYFSQGKRTLLKKQHPEMKNTEVSRLLGDMWRNAPDAEKRPHIEKEKEEREKYKVAIAEWRKESEARQAAQKKAAAELPPPVLPDATGVSPSAAAHYDHSAAGAAAASPYHAGQYMYQPPGYPYPYPNGPYGFPHPPNSAKQPVILGPTGVPHHYPPPPVTSPPFAEGGFAPVAEEAVAMPEAHVEYTDSVETSE